jgi:type II secretory pathway pseudopilin PulG
MKIDTNKAQKGGFTIVELLTVMGIIAILIGLLVPALAMVKDYAKQVQQAAQFHSIEVGLDLYKAEFGAYPPSNDNSVPPVLTRDPIPYCGANKLAESMVGLDFLGFHPNSDYRSSGQSDVQDRTTSAILPNTLVYNALNGVANFQTPEENVKCRGGKFGAPFIELESANAFRMDDIYPPAQLTTMNFRTAYPVSMVLCDVYAKKRNTASARKTGMPILYYRARTQFTEQDYRPKPTDPTGPGPFGGLENDIYYYPDNMNLMLLGTPDPTPIAHPLSDLVGGQQQDFIDFENMILNRQVTINPNLDIKRPYRAQSYILISAGKDGLYGTADDITNFKQE